MESIDRGIWDVVVHGPFIIHVVKEEIVEKKLSKWSNGESKKAHFDFVAKNIFTFALKVDEFFRYLSATNPKKCRTFLKSHMKELLISKEQESMHSFKSMRCSGCSIKRPLLR